MWEPDSPFFSPPGLKEPDHDVRRDSATGPQASTGLASPAGHAILTVSHAAQP